MSKKIGSGDRVKVIQEGHALISGAKARVLVVFSDGVARLAVPDLGGGIAHVPLTALAKA